VIDSSSFSGWVGSQTIKVYRHFDFGAECNAKIIIEESIDSDDEVITMRALYSSLSLFKGISKYKKFAVTCKCGHVGKEKYIPITFYVLANSKKDASRKAKNFPRVKKDHKDAVLDAKEVSTEEFIKGIKENDKDPYLLAKSIQDQRRFSEKIFNRIVNDRRFTNKDTGYGAINKPIYDKKERVKKPRVYMKNKNLLASKNFDD